MSFRPTIDETRPLFSIHRTTAEQRFQLFLEGELAAAGHDHFFLHHGPAQSGYPEHHHASPSRYLTMALDHLEGGEPGGETVPIAVVDNDGSFSVLRTATAISEHVESIGRVTARAYNALFLALRQIVGLHGEVFNETLSDSDRKAAEDRYRVLTNLVSSGREAEYAAHLRSFYTAGVGALGVLPQSDLASYKTGYVEKVESLCALKAKEMVGAVGRQAWYAAAGSSGQHDALLKIGAVRQRALVAIGRVTQAAAVRTALETAKAELGAIVLPGVPEWQSAAGEPLASTDRVHVVSTIANVAAAVRAANPGADPRYGNVLVEVVALDEGLQTSVAVPTSDIRSHQMRVWFTDPSIELVRPLTAVLRARNTRGPSTLTLEWRRDAPRFQSEVLPPQSLVVGTDARIGFGQASGGYGTLRYSMDEVPDGMSFDTATRLLTGAPTTAAAAKTYTCRVTDQFDQSSTRTVVITVVAADD